jgi:hypothetical protein
MQPLDITDRSPITAGDILRAIASPAADPMPSGSKPGKRYLGVPPGRHTRATVRPPPSPVSRRSTISSTSADKKGGEPDEH